MSQVDNSLSGVSELTRNLVHGPLMILATSNENSYISPTMAPFLAYIISAIDHTICSSINAAIKTIEVVTENVIESSTTKAICSSINTTAAVTHNMIDSSLGYISSTLSSINLKLISLGQLLSNPADFFGAMRLNSRS